jgi:hypothetical protein
MPQLPVAMPCNLEIQVSVGVVESSDNSGCYPTPPVSDPSGNWQVSWHDEFSGNSINTNYWDPEGFWYSPNTGSGGGEDLDTSSQCSVDGSGHLDITAIRQNSGKYSWASCSIDSAPESGITGEVLTPPFYIEFGATLPHAGAGLWPALWLLHTGSNYQEADLMESIGDPTEAYATWHQSSTESDGQQYGSPTGADLSQGEHTYGAYMTSTTLQWYLDGKQIVDTVPITDPGSFYIVMNLAVGDASSWPGASNSSTPSPSVLSIDYVRVYK